MPRSIRPAFAGVIVLAACTSLLIVRSPADVGASAQAPRSASAAPITAEQAAPFIGDWLVSVGMNTFEATFAVAVKAEGGKGAATVSAAGQPTINVSDTSLAGNNLVLRYSTDLQGSPVPTTMTLTPDGQGLRVNMALMDGQFEMAGSATKQAPGTPVRATGFGGGGRRGSATNDQTDFTPKPPYRPRTPAEQAAGFMLPAGYRLELVAADPDLLKGLGGPLDGRTYRDVMVPMAGTDEWVANIASYVRSSFGNSGGMVTPADVARVRNETANRKTPWTLPELEGTLPRLLDSSRLKVTSSHAAESAAGAASLRGWTSGAPQAAGMWVTVELPEPSVVSELQFDSAAFGGGRGAPGTTPPPAPVVGFPRGYSVQVSADGTNWGKPLVEGKGAGARTTIPLPPTRGKFLRITQTDTVADAPPWSIRNLRIYEAPAAAAKQ